MKELIWIIVSLSLLGFFAYYMIIRYYKKKAEELELRKSWNKVADAVDDVFTVLPNIKPERRRKSKASFGKTILVGLAVFGIAFAVIHFLKKRKK